MKELNMMNYIRDRFARLGKTERTSPANDGATIPNVTPPPPVDCAAQSQRSRQAEAFELFRGGSAPLRLRHDLHDIASPFLYGDLHAIDVDETMRVTGKLWNCTNKVPQSFRIIMQLISRKPLPERYTYAMAARFMRSVLVERCVPEIERRRAAYEERFVFVPRPTINQQDVRARAA